MPHQPPTPNPQPLLLTGFEPFGPNAVNPSWLVAEALDGWTGAGGRVAGVRLPVHWREAGPALAARLAEGPRRVLLLGLAARETEIRVEMRAHNVGGPIQDNSGALPPAPDLIAGGPASRTSTFPGPQIVARLAAAGLPVTLSTDAGQYLCNFVLYHALTWAATREPLPSVGFIHLPPLEVVSLADEIRAVRLAIEIITAAGRQGLVKPATPQPNP